jgi:hypothetical protein
MKTLQIDVPDDKFDAFMTVLKSLKDDFIDKISIKNETLDLDIESIPSNDEDFLEIQKIKKQNNHSYSLDEAKKILGI